MYWDTGLAISTVAPLITAPDESSTVPRTVPEFDCPHTGSVTKQAAASVRNVGKIRTINDFISFSPKNIARGRSGDTRETTGGKEEGRAKKAIRRRTAGSPTTREEPSGAREFQER